MTGRSKFYLSLYRALGGGWKGAEELAVQEESEAEAGE